MFWNSQECVRSRFVYEFNIVNKCSVWRKCFSITLGYAFLPILRGKALEIVIELQHYGRITRIRVAHREQYTEKKLL